MNRPPNRQRTPRRNPILSALAVVLLMAAGIPAVKAADFPPAIDLADLVGNGAMRLDGVESGDSTGRAVSNVGDINGDGIDDIMIAAPAAEPNGLMSGSCYVVFGQASPPVATLDLASLDGSNGFRIDGERSGQFVGDSIDRAGDVNGDGIDDLIIGAQATSGPTHSFVLFGRNTPFPAVLSVSSLDGSNGYRIRGRNHQISAAGDINGDDFDDLLVGSEDPMSDPSGFFSTAYVVFGVPAPQAAEVVLTELDGSNGFRIDGEPVDFHDFLGTTVSEAGDFNGDGFDDLIFGDPGADHGGHNAGSAYVVFGHAGPFAARLSLSGLDGSTGFRVDGPMLESYLGTSVSDAGDVNGDGLGDVMLASAFDGFGQPRGAFVIFGRGIVTSGTIGLDELDGSKGLLIEGRFTSINSAGDLNGDELDDMVLAYVSAQPNGNASGSTYVVFGRDTTYSAVLPLAALDGLNGFRLDGAFQEDSGTSASSAGDFDGDGVDELLVGVRRSSANGITHSGAAYLVYGRYQLYRDGFE